ncbi:hypothetical protein U879_18345 [Defluviimonas sp. 20V17]|uniref:Heavy-metal resistance n=1 Tax=Allgaiera indica TaxID=765699 RepID=A0AAN4ZZU7_9RHOB|nr:periplasmic heavy metal sensor [Allgaiera indica]KDB02230.1 hypothetical protein U879_18345 [Defluviimonas sp. 20V17]GHE02691.1 hypothetical protein GCM10008024_23230 [Allgaiera indica]SDX19173.1 Heavy-metal resistance [Allgaiera indica]
MSPGSPPPQPGPRPDPTPRTPLNRGWRILIVTSLGLNLLVLGAIGGALFGEWRGHGRVVVRDLGFGPYGAALSRADRVALMQAFARETGGFGAERRLARETFGKLLRVLRRTPFDAGEFGKLMTEQEQHMARRMALGQKLLVQRVESMDARQRHAFADRLEAALARHEMHHRRPGPPPPGPEAPAPAKP